MSLVIATVYQPPITPTTPPPLGGVIEAKLELRPISKESVAVIEPAPALVMPKMPAQVIVDAEPTETVQLAAELNSPEGSVDVPLIVRAPVTVDVTEPAGMMVFPLPTVSEP